MTRAVVFAYHNVGVRCLTTLLAHGVDVSLVVTHEDNPQEEIWFDSVADIADRYGIPCIKPADTNAADVVNRITRLQPDFLFSFYYRAMLKAPLLAIPSKGALNMHGSLLPKYRGRVPVNWAIIHGEKETGATLHYMVEKPDAGDILAQTAVPILPDDTSLDVFNKVTIAAELTLHRILPDLLAGRASRRPQQLNQGSYFGGRQPADGVIDWHQSAWQIHNLVRALSKPYPGAFTTVQGDTLKIWRTQIFNPDTPGSLTPTLKVVADQLIAECGGGGQLRILALSLGEENLTVRDFISRFGSLPLTIPS